MLLLGGWRSRALISLVCMCACQFRDTGIRAPFSAWEGSTQSPLRTLRVHGLLVRVTGGYGLL